MVLKKVLLTGGSGILGKELLTQFEKTDNIILAPTSKEMDITQISQCKKVIETFEPDILIHAAAYTDTKKAELEYLKCLKVNVNGTANLMECCQEKNIKMVYISTDYVFDGNKGNYKTTDSINPIGKYAKTKAAAELIVRLYENSLIIRTSFFGYSFPYDSAYVDIWSSKDYVDKISNDILKASLSDDKGIKHCGSKKRSLFEIAKERKRDVLPIFSDRTTTIPRDTSLNFEE